MVTALGLSEEQYGDTGDRLCRERLICTGEEEERAHIAAQPWTE